MCMMSTNVHNAAFIIDKSWPAYVVINYYWLSPSSQSSHPAVLRWHVCHQHVLGGVHSKLLIRSPPGLVSLMFVSVSVSLKHNAWLWLVNRKSDDIILGSDWSMLTSLWRWSCSSSSSWTWLCLWRWTWAWVCWWSATWVWLPVWSDEWLKQEKIFYSGEEKIFEAIS